MDKKIKAAAKTAGDLIIIRDDDKPLENCNKSVWVMEKMLKGFDWTEKDIAEYLDNKEKKLRSGTQFAFMPSFYAIGNKV